MLSLKTTNWKALTMWMTPKYMITIIRPTNHPMDRRRKRRSPEPPSTMRTTAMVIKINNMGIFGTAMIVTTTQVTMTMMTCGDCNVDDISCPHLLFLCIYDGVVGAFYIRTESRILVGWSVFGKAIANWQHSVWSRPCHREVLGLALSCHLQLQRQYSCSYVSIP